MMKMKKKKRPTVIPGDLGYFNTNLDYYKKMKQLLEAKQTQVDLISLRRKAIQDSNRLNYQNEYDRIRGLLSNRNEGLRGNTRERLEQRQAELEALGAQAFNKIVKNFYSYSIV